MVPYFTGVFRTIFNHGLPWWLSLFFAWLVGLGFFQRDEYDIFRKQVSEWFGGPMIPAVFPFWLLALMFLVWLCAQLVHREAMRHCRKARIVFGETYVDRGVPLYEKHFETGVSRLIGMNDIAKIKVRNVPFDGANGRPVDHAFGRFEVYDLDLVRVLDFDYPRWEENNKTGYEGAPRDRYPDEWNRRSLRTSGETSTLNFLVKSIEDECAYGFRGRSQLAPQWHDNELRLPSGEYVCRLTVSGQGLEVPAHQWLELSVGKKGCSIEVRKRRPMKISKQPWLRRERPKADLTRRRSPLGELRD